MLKARFAMILSTAIFALAFNFAPVLPSSAAFGCTDGTQWAGSPSTPAGGGCFGTDGTQWAG